MKGINHIGTLDTLSILKMERKISRDLAIENNTYSIPSHKVHASKKTYTRKTKHKKPY
jgi:hypothetical protein